MWQSKKNHTSFVKSFLHQDSEEGRENSPQDPQKNKKNPPVIPAQTQTQQGHGGFVQDFFQLSSLEDESVSLKVLGI